MLTPAFFWGTTLVLLLAARWIGGKWKWGYLVGGLCFGLYNEFLFEFCWDYSPALKPFIWRDVPLVVVVGWGVIGILALSISDRLQSWIVRRFSRFDIHPVVLLLLLDVLLYLSIGVSQEIMLSEKGYWKYNFPIQGTRVCQLLGYVGVALQVSSLGRRIEQVRTSS